MTELQAEKIYSELPDKFKNFFTLIEGYYGEYNSCFVKVFIAHDLKDFSEQDLSLLFDLVRKDYSRNYKQPPDSSLMIKAWENNLAQSGFKKVGNHIEDKNGNIYTKDIVKIGHYDGGRFIPFVTNEIIRKKVIDDGDRISVEKYISYLAEIKKDIVVRK